MSDTLDKEIGLYEKYRVERCDGSSEEGGKHEDCRYFVLDLTHDPHAAPALRAYAKSCATDYPMLAFDLRQEAAAIELGKINPEYFGEQKR